MFKGRAIKIQFNGTENELYYTVESRGDVIRIKIKPSLRDLQVGFEAAKAAIIEYLLAHVPELSDGDFTARAYGKFIDFSKKK